MPVYKHSVTGQTAVHHESFVDSFPEGTWEKVEDESEEEKRAREKEEAALAKVNIEDDEPGDGNAESVGEAVATDTPSTAPAAKKGGTKK